MVIICLTIISDHFVMVHWVYLHINIVSLCTGTCKTCLCTDFMSEGAVQRGPLEEINAHKSNILCADSLFPPVILFNTLRLTCLTCSGVQSFVTFFVAAC